MKIALGVMSAHLRRQKVFFNKTVFSKGPRATANINLGRGALVVLLSWASIAHGISPQQFEDVSSTAGMLHPEESYAACWGDYDGDGAPDLYANNHRAIPTLYRNDGTGVFEDIVPEVWFGSPKDNHGCAWADFDRDGDMDLMDITGGPVERKYAFNQFHVNKGISFDEESVLWNLDYLELRGRAPLWFDYDSDGFLDIALMGYVNNDGRYPSAIFRRETDHFRDSTSEVGFDCGQDSLYATLSDLSGDGRVDLICHGFSFPQKVYDLSKVPFQDISAGVPKQSSAWDTAIADFTGDLLPDIYVAKNPGTANVEQTADTIVQAKLKKSDGLVGFDFDSSGELFVAVYSESLTQDLVYIGSSGWHPVSEGRNPYRSEFTLSSSDPTVFGLKDQIAGQDRGLYIGYVESSGTWEVRLRANGSGVERAGLYLSSGSTIAELTPVGFDPDAGLKRPGYLVNTGDGFDERAAASGFTPVKCNTVAPGDFDNDMDLDLYLACGHVPANRPNRLYENQGDGTFVEVPSAAGAAGTSVGLAQNAAVADVNMDGFLDIFVSNGGNVSNVIPNGPDQLFMNKGNANHWIELDLRGTVSNPHGIGARIVAEAGGVQQLREVGAMHVFTQDFQRVHFGLGANAQVDNLTIHWPSGVVQEVANLEANQIYTVTEPGDGPLITVSDAAVDEAGGQMIFTVSLSEVATDQVSVGYQTVDGTAVAPDDYGSIAEQTLNIALGSTTGEIVVDVVDDGLLEGNETFSVILNNVMNGTLLDAQGIGTIFDNELSGCGEPNIDAANEKGVFIWQECPSKTWNMRVTGAGSVSTIAYEGQVVAEQPFPSSPLEWRMENNDLLDSSNPLGILYSLKVIKAGRDGFAFEAPATGETCFEVSAPGDVQIYVGAGKDPVGTAVDLDNLSSCNVTQ